MTTCSDNTCGTGFGTVVLPSDPSNNSILTATPAFGGVDVSWTYPATNPHAVAYVKVYKANNDNFMSAILIANVGGDQYYDKAIWTSQIQYYYWIQIVSVNGTVGELIGPASAIARPTIEDIIEQLSGSIEYGALSMSLKADIDAISLNKTALEGSVTQITNEQILIRDSISLIETDLQSSVVLINEEIQARQSAGEAYASSLNTLAVTLGDDIAAVQTVIETTITELDGKVLDIGALYTTKLTVNGLVGGFGVYNDGTEVEAGFDVDTFWIGRTNADKIKPFIVSGGEVFINQAVIENASIDIAKIDKATITNLAALNANMGNITAGQIKFSLPGDPTSYVIIDSQTQNIRVYNAGVLRVKIGNLA